MLKINWRFDFLNTFYVGTSISVVMSHDPIEQRFSTHICRTVNLHDYNFKNDQSLLSCWEFELYIKHQSNSISILQRTTQDSKAKEFSQKRINGRCAKG